MRGRGSRWAAGALGLAAALTGCTSTVRGTATYDPGPPPDAAHLQAALPQLADVPAGWDTYGYEESDSATLPALAACLGGRDTTGDRLVVRLGHILFDEDDDTVKSMIASYRSQQDVDDDSALLTSPQASGCLTRMLDSSLPVAGPEVADRGPLTFTMTPAGSDGPSNVVATGRGSYTMTLTTGESYPVFVESVFLTGRQTEAEVFFQSAGVPFPTELRNSLVTTVAQRLAAL